MKKELSDRELETYSRQISLEDIDYEGQLRLRNSKACIIGMGGLGSLIALKLVAMGIGTLRMVDRDIVSRSDLHRQYLYDVDSVGLAKVEVAFRKLSRLNPDVNLDPVADSLNSKNAEDLIRGADVVLDGLDRPEPRYIMNRTCNKLGVPYVFGAAIEAFGNVTTILPGRTICLECFMPGLRDENLPKCAVVGVHPSVLGIVTALQTYEAVRILVGKEPLLQNRLLYIDLRRMKFHDIQIEKAEYCPVCGDRPGGPPEPVQDKFFEETCARDSRRNFIVSPKKKIEIDLDALYGMLVENGFQANRSGLFAVTFEKPDGVMNTILKGGTMITQTSIETENSLKEEVLGTYRSIIVDGLGFPSDTAPTE